MHGDAARPLGSATSRARLLTIVWLASSAVSILLLPMVGVAQESNRTLQLAATIAIAAFFLATATVLWSAVTPWTTPQTHRRADIAFVGTVLLSIPLVAPVASQDWDTWAWLGAAAVGATPLLWRWPVALTASALITGISAALAATQGTSLWDSVVITAGIGASIAAVNWAPVWLWDLLVRAETSQATVARLASTEERLRFARDVHDVLGHDLAVIALKTELAARTAMSDPAVAAREAAEARELAETALDRVRATAAGYRAVDLPRELEALADLLTTAGVRCQIDAERLALDPTVAGALSAVAKEAATNLLRHSGAGTCRISLSQHADGVVLTVRNDGVRRRAEGRPHSGSGLLGMRARLAAVHGDLQALPDGDTFTIVATVPT